MPGPGGGVRRAAVVVGRETEQARLLGAVHDVRSGGSAALFLLGEGGVGKTRLLSEVAAECRRVGLAVFTGRAPVTAPVAFSVMAEALRSWLRGRPDPPSLGPFDAGLRLVAPEWPAGDAPPRLSDAQLRLLAFEGVVRLARDVAANAGRGAAFLLDDLHAADADSIEAVRYLVSSASPGVLLVGALRSREASAAEHVARALTREGTAQALELEPLAGRQVADLLSALLDAEPPAELVDDVVARTDGVPLLVEEVLDAHLRAGSVELSDRGARWRGGNPVVSRTIRDMVQARLERLPRPARDVLVAGATLGDFDVALLAAVAQQPPETVGDALVAGTSVGLLERPSGAVMFRHAVIREAVLDATLSHVLVSLHRRAADALADPVGHPDHAGDPARLERRAHHLAEIGDFDDAATLLTAASARRLHEHALLGAEATAAAAGRLARSPGAQAAARDALAAALAAQGRWSESIAVDEETNRLDPAVTPARWRRMAACAVEAGRPDVAAIYLARAVDQGDRSAEADIVSGRMALAAGDGEAGLAAAQRALADPSATTSTSFLALDLLGRALDLLGRRPEAETTWTRLAEQAAAAGATDAHLRAVLQLAKLELFEGQPPRRMYEARNLTQEAGALIEQAWAEELLSIALTVQGDPAAALQVATEAAARCRALRLDALPYLLASQAGATTFFDRDRANALFDEAEAAGPTTDVRLHTASIRADVALRDGRYDEAVTLFEDAVEAMRALPGNMPSDSPYYLVLARLAAGRPEEALKDLEYARSLPNPARWHGRPVTLAAVEALVAGSAEAFDAALATATGRMALDMALMRVLAAEILDTPARARWLREALDIYEEMGAVIETGRVRRLLRQAGGPVPRRRRADPTAAVPDDLARLGVTSREAEVLHLLGEGVSNAVIAERLFLSVRTVEAHVSSLLAKLHVQSRGQLTALRVHR